MNLHRSGTVAFEARMAAIEAMRRHGTYTAAADAAGRHLTTLTRWRRRSVVFELHLQAARAEHRAAKLAAASRPPLPFCQHDHGVNGHGDDVLR